MAFHRFTASMAAAALAAAGTAAQAAPSAYAKAADGDKLLCKFRTRTGTRFTSKMCRTVAEWDAIAEAAKLAFAEGQNRPSPNVGCVSQDAGSSPASVAVSGGCASGL